MTERLTILRNCLPFGGQESLLIPPNNKNETLLNMVTRGPPWINPFSSINFQAIFPLL